MIHLIRVLLLPSYHLHSVTDVVVPKHDKDRLRLRYGLCLNLASGEGWKRDPVQTAARRAVSDPDWN